MKLFDVVRLKQARRQEKLPAGSEGTIVHVHGVPSEAFEVEFCDRDGHTLAVLTLEPDELEHSVPS